MSSARLLTDHKSHEEIDSEILHATSIQNMQAGMIEKALTSSQEILNDTTDTMDKAQNAVDKVYEETMKLSQKTTRCWSLYKKFISIALGLIALILFIMVLAGWIHPVNNDK